MNIHDHHKHIHPGRPSSFFFTTYQVLEMLNIRNGYYVLDAGCGDGFISIAASRLVGNTGLVFAIDVDGDLIERLKKEIAVKEIENIEAMQADISISLPIEDDKIDLCLMVNVFHGLVENNEVESSIKEIKRVGKAGSTFTIIEFKKVESSPGPPISIRLDPEQLEMILKRYDFKKHGYFEIGPYHYGISFKS